MIKKTRTYIEREPWDENLIREEKYLKAACRIVMILFACYMAPVLLGTLLGSILE